LDPWWCDYSTLRKVGIRNNAFENPDVLVRALETNALIGGGQCFSIRRHLVRRRAEHSSVDLGANLQYADTFFLERFAPICQAFVERTGIDAPDTGIEQFAFEPPVIRELDLAAEGIATVLWTSGYRLAFEWIQVESPVIDELGLPIADGGVTHVPGLSFLGTPWLVDMGSANLVGIARDAEALAERW